MAKRDPTRMQDLQRQDIRESQLKGKVGKKLAPGKGVKEGLKPKPEGTGRHGNPY